MSAEEPPKRYTREELETKGLMPEEIDELIKNFEEMDADKSGYLEFSEVVEMVKRESGVSEEEAAKMAEEQLKFMDTDGDRKITFNEYVDALC